MTSVEPDIDALYQQPLSAFTAARNALAKTLSGAEAHRIKRLAKPTLVPWTVNQLYWRARDVYDRVSATGRTLRDAQIAALKGRGVDSGAPRRITEKRSPTRCARAEAGGEGGAHPSADQLGRMLEALSLAKQPPETPGRLTELLQPSGFEALAGIAPAAVDRPQPSSRPSGTPAPRATGPRLVTSPPATPKPDPADSAAARPTSVARPPRSGSDRRRSPRHGRRRKRECPYGGA